VHLVAGILLIVSVYLPVEPGSVADNAVKFVAVPAAVLTGVVLWQWPAVRRALRRTGRDARAGVGS
jgi:hypothetical protein